jgi:hypothetical protein
MVERPTGDGAPSDSRDDSTDWQRARSTDVAVAIGTEALELAKRARAAGLASVAHLLEAAALQAGSDATVAQWPTDRP